MVQEAKRRTDGSENGRHGTVTDAGDVVLEDWATNDNYWCWCGTCVVVMYWRVVRMSWAASNESKGQKVHSDIYVRHVRRLYFCPDECN